eukprot:7001255-Prymnesium_polylepis.1
MHCNKLAHTRLYAPKLLAQASLALWSTAATLIGELTTERKRGKLVLPPYAASPCWRSFKRTNERRVCSYELARCAGRGLLDAPRRACRRGHSAVLSSTRISCQRHRRAR